jgi:putative DNA primase/helicase
MQFSPHDPSLLLTKKINARYDPSATNGRFTRFMEEVLPDPAVRDYFQRAVGYALTGEANQRAIFLLHGESGTGKSQVLEVLSAVFGDFAATVPGSAFKPRQDSYKGPSDDLHKLKGKRLAIQSELDQGAVLNEGLIKSVTGGDTQTTRELYGKYEDWRPQCTVFLATNYLPRISSSDNAIWKRVKPIKFEQVFVDQDGMPLDPGSADLGAMLAATEPEVILNWVLEGMRSYREHGLRPPEHIRGWLSDYRDETDTVRQFIIEGQEEGVIRTGEGMNTGARELYNAYNSWCQHNHVKPLGSTNFLQRMESSGWQRKRMESGQRWLGVALTGYIKEAQTAPPSNWWQRE